MSNLSSILSFFLLISIFSFSRTKRPIIGIYGNPYPIEDYEKNNADVIVGAYVRWLESFGAEVVAIHQWYTTEELDTLLSKINGVLFQGGNRIFNPNAPWEKNGLHIINYSISTGLPLWGTCMGFEFICDFVAGENVLESYEDKSFLHGAIPTETTKTCRMFSQFTDNDHEIYEKSNSTIYFHVQGVSPEEFNKREKLTSLFDITSLGKDKNGKVFVNSIESKEHNIFATQYHPEKNPYIRQDSYELEHTIDSLKMSHKIGLGFIYQAMINNNFMIYQERLQYDFINTNGKGTEDRYDKTSNSYYFIKKTLNINHKDKNKY